MCVCVCACACACACVCISIRTSTRLFHSGVVLRALTCALPAGLFRRGSFTFTEVTLCTHSVTLVALGVCTTCKQIIHAVAGHSDYYLAQHSLQSHLRKLLCNDLCALAYVAISNAIYDGKSRSIKRCRANQMSSLYANKLQTTSLFTSC